MHELRKIPKISLRALEPKSRTVEDHSIWCNQNQLHQAETYSTGSIGGYDCEVILRHLQHHGAPRSQRATLLSPSINGLTRQKFSQLSSMVIEVVPDGEMSKLATPCHLEPTSSTHNLDSTQKCHTMYQDVPSAFTGFPWFSLSTR